MNRNVLFAVALAALLLGGVRWYQHRPIDHPPGVLVAGAPLQREPSQGGTIRHGAFELVPLADFSLEARVLSREDYRLGRESDLSPTDLALGWGAMSDSAVLDRLDLSQSARFFRYRWQGEPPIPEAELTRSASNMHMIPADARVARALARVRKGDIVAIDGVLVEARADDGWRWRSSLSREDSGGGACELVYVRSLVRLR